MTMTGCPFASSSSAPSGTHDASKSDHQTPKSSRDASSSSSSSSMDMGMGSCPFARALHDSGDDSSSLVSLSSAASASASASASGSHHQPWNDCPVFANRSCPFRDAKSPDEISEILSKLPPSHRDQSNHSQAAVWIETTLAVLHRDKALEEYSFSAILSRLVLEHHAKQQQQQQQQQQQDEEESKDEPQDDGHELDHDHDHDHEDHSSASSSIMDGDDSEAFRLAPPTKLGEDHHQNHQNHHHHDTLPKSQKHGRRLSEALKTGTEEAHKEAESVHFVRNFIRGIIDRRSYALFVAQMFHVYKHLERALEEHAPRHFAECHFPVELNRSEALREDVDFWHSTSGSGSGSGANHNGDEADPPISPATQDYLDRIDEVARTRPILLLAHAYTRYLGDLSGGKVLARVAKRALRLEKGADGTVEGLAFYDFPLLKGSVKAFKDKYRQALNDLDIENDNNNNNNNNDNDNDETVRAIVKEANVAFLLNMRLFEELDVNSSVPGASVRPIADVYARVAEIPAADEETAKNGDASKVAAPCPFLSGNTGRGSGHHAAGIGTGIGAVTIQSSGQKGHGNAKTCPWPFILLHDPKTGMKHWQTWLTIGLVVAHVYQKFLAA